MPDLAAAYAGARGRLVELVRSLDDTRLGLIVPATPLWTIKDVVAHLTHVAGEYAAGHHEYSARDIRDLAVSLPADLSGIDRWAQAGVEERRDRPLSLIIEEWAEQTVALTEMISGQRLLPEGTPREMLSWAAVTDLATHAQDIGGALGVAPDRDAYATKLAYASFTMMLESRAAAAGAPPLRIVTERGAVVIGAPTEPRTIRVDWYELLRAAAGRRSVQQITQLFVPIDVEPYLAIISPYPFPVENLVV